MRLTSISYSEFNGTAQAWRLDDLLLGESNLIVGKNASGKTRAINVISSLAQHLAGLKPAPISGDFDVKFNDAGNVYHYLIRVEDEEVIKEVLELNSKVLLDRGQGGVGTIWAEALEGGRMMEFQTPPSEFAVVARRDTIQHSFLEALHAWGSSVRHYAFGTSLGKDRLVVLIESPSSKIDDRDTNAVVGLFKYGEKRFGRSFNQAIIDDMLLLDYDLTDIGVASPISVRISSGFPVEPVGLYVKERQLSGITDHLSMSQGMFRCLSMLIQLNYSQLSDSTTCVLIDDIGEGLDFDRACRLIDLLREKARSTKVQLIMSTNDRFVMNHVPLEEWSFLRRTGSDVSVMNYGNSRGTFEEFKFTGLSNFSFLEMDFANGGPVEEAAVDA